MQLCAVRSCGVVRNAISLEIGRRPDHGHAHFRADPHRDHVLGDLLAEAHARVVAGRDDVGQAIVDDDLDLDVGMVRQEPPQGRLQDGDRRMLAGRDADRACRLAPQLAERSQLRLDLLEPGSDGLQQPEPASVGATLRVVRVSSRSFSRSSRPLMVWLRADCETPSLAPALVKLRSFATTAKAARSLKFGCAID